MKDPEHKQRKPESKTEAPTDLDQPKTDQDRIRIKGPGTSQPEEAAVEQNVRRGAPRHRE